MRLVEHEPFFTFTCTFTCTCTCACTFAQPRGQLVGHTYRGWHPVGYVDRDTKRHQRHGAVCVAYDTLRPNQRDTVWHDFRNAGRSYLHVPSRGVHGAWFEHVLIDCHRHSHPQLDLDFRSHG